MFSRIKTLFINHAQFAHALRVSLAIAFCIAFYSVVPVPHSMWGPVTVVVVMMQPYAGVIVYKGFQRIGGTLLGATLGLVTVFFPQHLNYLIPVWMLVWVFLLSLKSYGKNIYFFFLAVMTLIIVSYQGSTALEVSVALWRVANILIGSLIAMAFSFLLPIRAVTTWNKLFNDNLHDIKILYKAHASAHMLSIKGLLKIKHNLVERHMKMVVLLPNVKKEKHKLAGHYQAILTIQSSLISIIDQLIETHWSSDISRRQLLTLHELTQYQQQIANTLDKLTIQQVYHLELPNINQLQKMTIESPQEQITTTLGLYGYLWLTRQFVTRLDELIVQLQLIK